MNRRTMSGRGIPPLALPPLALPPLALLASTAAITTLRRHWWASVIVEDILGPEGGPTSGAAAINRAGVVAGSASGRGFRWHDGELEWLTELDVGSRALAIDRDGSVVGARFRSNDDLHPVRWHVDGTVLALPLPAEASMGVATGAAGELTAGWVSAGGTSSAQPRTCHKAWVWIGDRGQALETDGAHHGEATGVSRGGMIVGSVLNSAGAARAHVWSPDGRGRPLPGPDGGRTEALACNAAGTIVGLVATSTTDERACVWPDATAEPVMLDTLGGPAARAVAVADCGTIAGWSLAASGYPHACVWEPSDPPPAGATGSTRYTIVDLGTLGGQTSAASAVNDAGLVVGTASRGRGAINAPLRPGGWSWEDHAFMTSLDDHRS